MALALLAGLALADSSIVTLGLPSILVELESTVEGVALVLGVYTAVLAIALLPAARLSRRLGPARLGSFGIALFGLASLGCGLTDSLPLLLALRAVQAIGGAGGLVAAFELLDGGTPGPGRRLWVGASVFGVAVGPALGGALTEAFDWRAIFLAQVPIAVPSALVCWRASRLASPATPKEAGAGAPPPSPLRLRLAAALALLSAALTAVIFLVVLLLVAGWSIQPLAAALAVSVLPAAALIASRLPGAPETRAATGCLLVGAGVGCLALLPSASAWWTVPPQLLAGAGMGLALPALSGELMPERNRGEMARLLSIRHLGIAFALAALAPIISSSLDSEIKTAREQGTAIMLDAELPPETKIRLSPQLFAGVDTDDPRGELERSIEEAGADLDGEEAEELEAIEDRLDKIITDGVRAAFRIAFIVTAGLGLVAALLLLFGAGPVPRLAAAAGAAVVAGAIALGAYGVAFADSEREKVALTDPCQGRDGPNTGGVGGLLQSLSLEGLDRAACEFGSSREELLLALFDDELREEYEEEYDVDPRSPLELGPAILGL